MKICIKTLGCKVNSYESEFIRSLFLRRGYEIVEDNADIYVVNTCTVTNESDRKSRKTINSIKKNNPNAIVVALGCFCENKKANIREYIDADIILGNYDKSKVVDYLEEYLENKTKKEYFYDMNKVSFEDMEINKFETKARAFVKIEDGCNNYCNYCIIPYVRGRVRSKNKDLLLKEIETLGNSGHKEIVLTGIHTGQYGRDTSEYNLAELIHDIRGFDNIFRIRLSSIEVVELTEEVLEELKNNNKFVSHLHIPLQSGSDQTLKDMNRRYDKENFRNKIKEIRDIRKDISISTDVIVGYPTETEENFIESYNFCKEMNFSKIHVFPYSDREGTVASKSLIKVSPEEKKRRARELINLSNELEKKYNESFDGKELDILFEEYKEGYYIGHSSNYVKVKIKGDYRLHEIFNIKIKKEDIVENIL